MKYPLAGSLQKRTTVTLTGNPPGDSAPPLRSDAAEIARVRAIIAQRDLAGIPTPHWDVFWSDEYGFMIEADDESNAMAEDAGLQKLTDDDVALLPEAQRALRETIEREEVENGGPWGVWPGSGPAKGQVDNPERDDGDVIVEFRRLIRQRDVHAMTVAEDLALEHQMSPVTVSETGKSGGKFILSVPIGYVIGGAALERIDGLDQVEWEVEAVRAGQFTSLDDVKKMFGVGIRFAWHGDDDYLVLPQTSGLVFHHRDAAARAGAALAWDCAKHMKQLQVDEATDPAAPYATMYVRSQLLRVVQGTYKSATAPALFEERTMVRGRKVKPPTYLEARDDILAALRRAGWQVSPHTLKTPHATSPNGRLRLWFLPQAVHYTTESRYGTTIGHARGDARSVSYELDIRKLTPTEFIAQIEARFSTLFGGVK